MAQRRDDPLPEREQFSFASLVEIVESATVSARTKLEQIRESNSSISIADMFDMQMLMNQLSQFSEMSTAVVNASNQAIQSMARNVK
jgi:hypothetical protein